MPNTGSADIKSRGSNSSNTNATDRCGPIATHAAIRAVNTYLLVQSTDEISHYSPEDELAAQRKPPDIRGLMVIQRKPPDIRGLMNVTDKSIGIAAPLRPTQ